MKKAEEIGRNVLYLRRKNRPLWYPESMDSTRNVAIAIDQTGGRVYHDTK